VPDLVRVEGPDAATYLQGQLSQDVDTIDIGASAWSFVLSPTGHIDGLVEVTHEAPETFVLRVDHGLGEAVEARLRKFLLRTKATITLEPGEPDDDKARVLAGRPGPAELDERAVPAETGWVGRAVSFTKGCYTGQELVARMDSRVAEPPRRLVRVRTATAVAAGDAIEADGAAVGSVTSVVADGGEWVGLGYVKRGSATEGAVTIGGAPAMLEGNVGD
jgi:folate-binding protein YgfZ